MLSTVFTHLVDHNGQTVGGVDSQPREGKLRTSAWLVNTLLPGGIVIPIDADVSSGDHDLEVGLYDPTTMERLALFDANGQSIDNKVVIRGIHIIE